MGKKGYIQLSQEQIIEGTKHCFDNAAALKDEGDLLYQHQKWARATALYILGIEEVSKIELLGQNIINDNTDWKKFREKFLDHTPKLKIAEIIGIQAAYKSGNKERLIKELTDRYNGRNFNKGKLRCLYVDYNENGWEVPTVQVPIEDAEYCQSYLAELLSIYEKIFYRSEQELKKFIQEMQEGLPGEELRADFLEMKSKIIEEANKVKQRIKSQKRNHKK